MAINSTYQGGGVAEMISSVIPLMNDVGIDMGWRIFHGNPDFFSITKKFHNALQGESIHFTPMKQQLYEEASMDFSTYTHIDHDCVIVHDPQPLPLIKYKPKRQPWIWRCHVDLTNPNNRVWDYLKGFILRYDMMIVSNEAYLREDLPVEQRVVLPAIDPLSPKNKELPQDLIDRNLEKFGIPTDKPIITQISRFDKWKDPGGVVRVYRKVKEEVDCRLVLCGSMAADDPEGLKIFDEVERECGAPTLICGQFPDIESEEGGECVIAGVHGEDAGDIILITSENNILVNTLQRCSDVIIQKSLREGFGLTVTEALWKGRPVVASNVGGIPAQISDGENGFLVDPHDEDRFADRIIEVLEDPGLGEELGRRGWKTVRERFLITRLIMDYLDILNYAMR
ncbi:MAG: glycosyltransferase [Methanomicrobiaceae archaeon]|nr:glycosyltransferase [Methanomicrobiaceae archaeon]